MRLIEVEDCSMLSYHYDDNKDGKTVSRNKEQSIKLLHTTFGSKASNRVLEKKERMKVNVDVVKKQLDKTMNGMIVIL